MGCYSFGDKALRLLIKEIESADVCDGTIGDFGFCVSAEVNVK